MKLEPEIGVETSVDGVFDPEAFSRTPVEAPKSLLAKVWDAVRLSVSRSVPSP